MSGFDLRQGIFLAECCRQYLDHGLTLIAEWSDDIATDTAPGMFDGYRGAIREHAELLGQIISHTRPCPWHDQPLASSGEPDGYLRARGAVDLGGVPAEELLRPVDSGDRQEGDRG